MVLLVPGVFRKDQGAVEHLLEGIEEGLEDVVDGDVPPQLAAQRGDTFPLQPAGHDVVEPGEVGAAVQCQPVGSDVVPAVHPWGGSKHPPVSTHPQGCPGVRYLVAVLLRPL